MWKLFLGGVSIGFAPIFVRLVHVGPSSIGFYRCLIGGLILLFMPVRRGGLPAELPKKAWRYAWLAAVLFALDLFFWHRSVIYTGASYGTILANTQVFFVALISIVIYGERPKWTFLLAIPITFFGIWLLVAYRAMDQQISDRFFEGVVYGLLTGIMYAGYILSMRQLEIRRGRIPLEKMSATVSLLSAGFLLLFAVLSDELAVPSIPDWINLFLLALIAQVIGWLLITKNLPKTSATKGSLILMTQPVVATFAGYFFLGETLLPIQWAGAAIAVFGIYLGAVSRVL